MWKKKVINELFYLLTDENITSGNKKIINSHFFSSIGIHNKGQNDAKF
jgi:hypothetical protein